MGVLVRKMSVWSRGGSCKLGFSFILQVRITMVGYNYSGVFSVCIWRFQIALMSS
ncbi:hypothetical protein K443DRAFT_432108 [Laccaria amethystina LaAM-08-1]|uniref:Uncharacterized protein n=1 Tax=Laccaria amethystina LaAM-08-1 TaxID=1095629 RepID=A0A0C9Y283_9AGAR|nr:hypothetical protein K443DRAFT_432108 [Laccaria amethystina LaAM-08-1]